MSLITIGIDEAGYGPRLGPLVVGCVRVPGGRDVLRRALARRLRHLPAVIDSKRLNAGPNGFARLELTALAALTVARGVRPARVRDLGLGRLRGLADHPWYADLGAALPLAADSGRVERAATALARALAAAGSDGLTIEAPILIEGELNRRLLETGNKADVELGVIERLLDRQLPEGAPARVLCDRLGGRRFYGPWLQAQFPFCTVEVEEEAAGRSAYRFEAGGRAISIEFLVGGESRSPEIALASVIAKYHREVLMWTFNRFWRQRHPNLRPTAGYALDGQRFLRDIAADPLVTGNRERLVRLR